MPARFKIERRPLDGDGRTVWMLRDRRSPAFVGQYRTHELALRAADRIARRELGLPERLDITESEILEAMTA